MFLTMLGFSFTRSLFSIRKYFFILEITLQIVGIFTYGCFILMKMNYLNIAYMWGVFCLIPFLIDIISIVMAMIRFRKYQAVKL